MNERWESMRRWASSLPVGAAFVFHALASDRWLLVVPAIALVVIAVVTGYRRRIDRSLYVMLVLGAFLGLLVPFENPTLTSPLPPALLSAGTGALIAFVITGVMADKVQVAWITTWGLMSMSCHVVMTSALSATLVIFLAASLVCAAWCAKLLSSGQRAMVAMSAFMLTVGLLTYFVSIAVQRMDGIMVAAVESFMFDSQTRGRTGIGREIRLDSRSTVELSKEPVLEITRQPTYLRANVLERFDGNRWSPTRFIPTAMVQSEPIDESRNASKIEDAILFLSDLGKLVPTPAGTSRVGDPNVRKTNAEIFSGKPKRRELKIQRSPVEMLATSERPSDELLFIPSELKTPIAEIANEIVDMKQGDREVAETLVGYFYENFEYSLRTDLSGPDHPMVTMLTEKRPAYCVYFASACALMMRSQGIPARIVSGYAPSGVNPLTGRCTVRQRDAHAWVEAWLAEESRFVAFDPTPPTSRMAVTGQDQTIGKLAATFEAIWSSIRRTWLRFQSDPVGWVRRLFGSPIAWCLLGVGVVFLIRNWRRGKSDGELQVGHVELVREDLRSAYAAYLKSVNALGVAPVPTETDEETIERLARIAGDDFAAAATEFIRQYRLARYGGEQDRVDLTELAQRVGNA